ncbi:S-layer homology domain-containing protein [Paenibacillus phoenicis]|uniref:S-layer homology domain-containing protein n=1 Tax=Paenibacillus phoenicis TaxID=554117 RepID=A0ABU5PHL7_9BACL|nr:S-layer homology domain-containing protein [Paenibacillus phoenicis]MEA3569376.1 S-layer homology domain-containing protein [Paenibacillus phoenicis]
MNKTKLKSKLNNHRKIKLAASLMMTSSLLLASSVSAFSDVQGQDAKITEALQQKGIIQGITKDHFVPLGKLTGAQGIHMIVKALELKPKAGGSLQPSGHTEWYASSLRIAEDNGIKLPKDFAPNAELSREAFADLLMQAINVTGNYPTIKMYIEVADADQMNPDYANSIQTLLLMKIASLDEQGEFHPKQAITRIEAARLVHNAADFVNKYKEAEQDVQDQVSFEVEKVNEQINKVVLTRAQQPNPGYGIRVAKVEFTGKTATVYYELLSPEPDKDYIQVITDTKAETYVSSEYQVEIKRLSE